MNEIIFSNFHFFYSFASFIFVSLDLVSSSAFIVILLECIVVYCLWVGRLCETMNGYFSLCDVYRLLALDFGAFEYRALFFQCDTYLSPFHGTDRFLSWFEIGPSVNHVTVNRITSYTYSWLLGCAGPKLTHSLWLWL